MFDPKMLITEDIKFVGVNDHQVDLFEGQYVVPRGMSYNSYVILDEKIAVMDTVDQHFAKEWLDNLEAVLAGRTPSYLVVQHMEPDHSANIAVFMEKYPEATVVSSAPAFNMMKNYFGTDFATRKLVIKEGSTLELGKHTLAFVAAPMVHWPEVMVGYDTTDKVLFSADGFGKFGANDVEDPAGWDDEARRYFIGIVGKFGDNVQTLLKKAATLEIKAICPLHGPVLKEDLGHYLKLYDIWSGYKAEEEGIVIAYTSVYGNTKQAALKLEEILKAKGQTVTVFDLARDDQSEAVAAAFRYSKLVLATTTYNTSIFPFMAQFLHTLKEHNFQGRTLALIENGTWAPMATKGMKAALEGCKNLTYTNTTVTIKGAVNESVEAKLAELAAELEA